MTTQLLILGVIELIIMKTANFLLRKWGDDWDAIVLVARFEGALSCNELKPAYAYSSKSPLEHSIHVD